MGARVHIAAALSRIEVVALVSTTSAARVNVRGERDQTFDFRHARSWAWDPTEEGNLLMARSADDDPAVVQRRFGPTIVEAIAAELGQRGLMAGVAEPSDVSVHHYLVVTIGFETDLTAVNPVVNPRLDADGTLRFDNAAIDAADAFVAVDLSANHSTDRSWQQPTRIYFTRRDNRWKLVGLDRLQEPPARETR
jgi:hypothetical protein